MQLGNSFLQPSWQHPPNACLQPQGCVIRGMRPRRKLKRKGLTCQAPPGRPLPRTRWGVACSGWYCHSNGEGRSSPKSLSGRRSESKSTATGLDERPSSPSQRYSRSCGNTAQSRCQLPSHSHVLYLITGRAGIYLLQQGQVGVLLQFGLQDGVGVGALRRKIWHIPRQQVGHADSRRAIA